MTRKYILLIVSALFMSTAHAAEANDTVNYNRTITYVDTESDDDIVVDSVADFEVIDSLECDSQFEIFGSWNKKKVKKRNSLDFGNFYFGFAKAVGSDAGNMDLNMGASLEVGFEPVRYTWRSKSRKTYFGVGVSFNWRNYRTTGRSRFFRDVTNTLTLAPYPDGASNTESSRIKVFSVGIPFTYGFNFHHNWRADISATLQFNTHATAQSAYSIADTDQGVTHHIKERYNDIHQSLVGVDLKAQVHWSGLGVYVKYSPCNVLDATYGPKFSAVTTGLVIGY